MTSKILADAPDGHHDNNSLAPGEAKISNKLASIGIFRCFGLRATPERQLRQNAIQCMLPGNRINESGDNRQGGGQNLGTGNNNMHGRLPGGTGGENRFRGGGC